MAERRARGDHPVLECVLLEQDREDRVGRIRPGQLSLSGGQGIGIGQRDRVQRPRQPLRRAGVVAPGGGQGIGEVPVAVPAHQVLLARYPDALGVRQGQPGCLPGRKRVSPSRLLRLRVGPHAAPCRLPELACYRVIGQVGGKIIVARPTMGSQRRENAAAQFEVGDQRGRQRAAGQPVAQQVQLGAAVGTARVSAGQDLLLAAGWLG